MDIKDLPELSEEEQQELWEDSNKVIEALSSFLTMMEVPPNIGVLALMRMSAAFAVKSLRMPPQLFMASMGEFYGMVAGCDMTVIVSKDPGASLGGGGGDKPLN
jgi:hypothetical protein